MASLNAQQLPGAKGPILKLTGATPSAGGDDIPCDGMTFLIAENTDDTDALLVTVKAEKDSLGRATDATLSIPAESFGLLGPFGKVAGWATPTGRMNVVVGTPANGKLYVGGLPTA